jgi:hypothetical protein
VAGNPQALALFGDGRAPLLHEDAMDRRFKKSSLAKLLGSGASPEGCRELLAGLFVALAETLPSLHRRDLNFWLDPVLIDAVNAQLSTPQFPALTFLQFMVRRLLLEHRLPDEWLATALALSPQYPLIDVPKLRAANEQLDLADSALLTIALVRERYAAEVLKATTAGRADAVARFRDTYLDRLISWPSLVVLDVIEPAAKRRAGELRPLVAHLAWVDAAAGPTKVDLLGAHRAPADPVFVLAKLAPKQFVDLEGLSKGQRVRLKGRLWEMNRAGNELEVRDAVLFYDRDWAAGVTLGDRAHLAQCPQALNDLTGISPDQQGGFRH